VRDEYFALAIAVSGGKPASLREMKLSRTRA
jgi:hypothetical protein